MLKIKKFVFNQFGENTYIIHDENSKTGMIIDPGCSNNAEEDLISEYVQKENINLKYLINSHCHIDHILGNNFIKEKFGSKFLAGEGDEFLLDLMFQQAESYGFSMKRSPNPDEYISEETNLPEFNLKFIHTPGHSPGEFCLYFPDEKKLVSGDVLFLEGIGRTDLWGGNYETLLDSIENKIFKLEDDVIVYPGHGDSTTIGNERKNNPFL